MAHAGDRHRYTLIRTGRRLQQFRAGCSCGWQSDVTYPSAGLASSAHTRHQEESMDNAEQLVDRAMNVMFERGWQERVADGELVRLTPAGRAALEAAGADGSPEGITMAMLRATGLIGELLDGR